MTAKPVAVNPRIASPGDVDPAAVAASGVGIVNQANALTLLRLLLVPVFIVLFMHDGASNTGWRIAAFAVYAVASLTDRADGYLARSRGLITEVGKIADPIADKALTAAALLCLSAVGDLPWWVTAVILAREVGITVLRFVVLRHGVIPASRGGKVKTLLQTLAIGLYVLPLSGVFGTVRFWLMAAALVVTIVTGVDYVIRAGRLRGAARRRAS